MDNRSCMKEFELVEIKSTSMDTENSTFPYVKSENETPLDRLGSYLELEDSKEHLMTILEGERICQLCKKICIHDFMPIKYLESDLTRKHIPKVKFSSTSEPVVCWSCLNSMSTHTHFTKNSSDLDGEISNISSEMKFYIKTEEIEIKSEEGEDGSLSGCDEEPCRSQTSQNHQVIHKTLSGHQQPTSEDSSNVQKYDMLTFKTKNKSHLAEDRLTHEDISTVQTYKRDTRDYQSKFKQYHLLTHGEVHKVQIYKCNKCNFENRHKSAVNRHQLIHRDVSEVRMYDCEKCEYRTRHKHCLGTHKLQHLDVSVEPMYTCGTCSYQSVNKVYFDRHQQRHTLALDGQMYMCYTCDYETKFKRQLKQHLMTHIEAHKLRMYKCHTCNYESRYKASLKRHRLKHMDVSEVSIYECGKCEYKSKHKDDLNRHQLKHMDVSELRMYSCDKCNYKSKYNYHVKQHLLAVHKDVSEVM